MKFTIATELTLAGICTQFNVACTFHSISFLAGDEQGDIFSKPDGEPRHFLQESTECLDRLGVHVPRVLPAAVYPGTVLP